MCILYTYYFLTIFNSLLDYKYKAMVVLLRLDLYSYYLGFNIQLNS